jgi:hypothetical protein
MNNHVGLKSNWVRAATATPNASTTRTAKTITVGSMRAARVIENNERQGLPRRPV